MMRLTADLVREIKKKLWDGATHQIVATMFGVSQPHVSRIAKGSQWADVVWPDGSFGGFPLSRRIELMSLREQNTAVLIDSASIHLKTIDVAVEVQHAIDAVEAEQEQEFLAAATTTKKEHVKRKGKKKQADQPRLSWAEVEQQDPNNQLICSASDDATKAAICIAFAQLPKSMWNTLKTAELVDEIKTKMNI